MQCSSCAQVLRSIGMDFDDADEPLPPVGVDWETVRVCGVLQTVFALVALALMLPAAVVAPWHNFTITAGLWAIFLLVAGLVGRRAYVDRSSSTAPPTCARVCRGAKRSHVAGTAYAFMVAFQTLMSLSSAASLFYVLYSADHRLHGERPRPARASVVDQRAPCATCAVERGSALLIMCTIVEAAALLVTTVTGLVGFRAMCYGWGRLLGAYETHLEQAVSSFCRVVPPAPAERPLTWQRAASGATTAPAAPALPAKLAIEAIA